MEILNTGVKITFDENDIMALKVINVMLDDLAETYESADGVEINIKNQIMSKKAFRDLLENIFTNAIYLDDCMD